MNVDEKLDHILDLIATIAKYAIDNGRLLEYAQDDIREVRELIKEKNDAEKR